MGSRPRSRKTMPKVHSSVRNRPEPLTSATTKPTMKSSPALLLRLFVTFTSTCLPVPRGKALTRAFCSAAYWPGDARSRKKPLMARMTSSIGNTDMRKLYASRPDRLKIESLLIFVQNAPKTASRGLRRVISPGRCSDVASPRSWPADEAVPDVAATIYAPPPGLALHILPRTPLLKFCARPRYRQCFSHTLAVAE